MELNKITEQVRRDVIRMVSSVKSGHPGGSLGCADFLVALYFKILKKEDKFILSNGHISPVYYSVLARSGHFDLSELNGFRKFGSMLQGHPTPHIPGVHVATGSLGQGLSVGIGIAESKRLNKEEGLVYVLTGDGELQEGQNWEAAMYASHSKLNNLIAIVDYNKKQIDGTLNDVISLGDLKKKWKSFGWEVLEINDGNKIDDILKTFEIINRKSKKPTVVLMHTEIGYGVDFMMGTHEWHGKAPNEEQTKNALLQLKETLGDF